MKRINPFRSRLGEGKRIFGCWSQLFHPAVAEMLALIGYDVVLIDMEHGPGELSQAANLMRAVQANGAAAVVRAPANDPVFLKRLLDQGPDAVMIPMVSSAEEARAVVSACRYPPRGTRGWAAGIARASLYGLDEDYTKTSSNDLVVICQIESRQAVDKVDAILAVDGVDMVFVGRNDLAAEAGRLLEVDHPEVEALTGRVLAAAKRAGKTAGTVPSRGRGCRALFEDGFDFVAGPGEISLLRDAAIAELDAVRDWLEQG